MGTTPKEITCEIAAKKCQTGTIRGDSVFRLLKNHLASCDECSATDYVKWLSSNSRNERGTRARVEFFVHLWQTYKLDRAAQQICKDYLIRCTSWDLKVKLSKYLSKIEIAESILKYIQHEPFSKLRWPTRSFTEKYYRFDHRTMKSIPRPVISVTPEEADNDELFKVASLLGTEYIRIRVMKADELLRMLEVALVMET